MKLGFTFPNIGSLGSRKSVTEVAQRAEKLGYDSLWTTERLLWPVSPKTPYPVTADGSLPEPYQHALDPLETLTFAAACTSKVGLGTSVLDLPYYNPVVLARRIATLDILSEGRARVGLGLGWSEDEFDAVGASMKGRGARADEFLAVLKAVWGEDPVEFQGKFYRVPKSIIQAKPVQKPHPPIYMAAYAPAALKRLATMADGWLPVGVPLEGMKQMFGGAREMAKAAGRDPDSLRLVVRANVEISESPLGNDRMIFTGTLDQIRQDVQGCRDMGAHEIFFDPTFYPGSQKLDRWLALMEEWRGLA